MIEKNMIQHYLYKALNLDKVIDDLKLCNKAYEISIVESDAIDAWNEVALVVKKLNVIN